jgi:hypothetical protein
MTVLVAAAWTTFVTAVVAVDLATGAPDLALSRGIRDFRSGMASPVLEVAHGLTAVVPLVLLVAVPIFRQVRGLRRWRQPLLLLLGTVTAVYLAAQVTTGLEEVGLPPSVFLTLVIIAPCLALTTWVGCRALRPEIGAVGEWEDRGPSQGRRLFTGRQPVRVIVLLLLSGALTLLGFVLFNLPVPESLGDGAEDPQSAATAFAFYSYILGLGFLWLGVVAYVQARRRAALRAAAIRALDSRAPVLYLRPFSDEKLRIPAHGANRRALVERYLGRRTDRFEEVIVWHLWKFGPVVSVGKPGDKLTPLGSAREYLSDDTWRQHIDVQMVEASLIVVQVGRSAGIGWEIYRLRHLGLDEKALFVIPPVEPNERAERWSEFYSIAGQVGWPSPPDPLPEDVLICRIVDGRWVIIAGFYTDEWNFEVALEMAVDMGAHRAGSRRGRPTGP